MRYLALATDYDGTLATHGHVDDTTLAALHRLKASGRKLILVTGRQVGDLFQHFSHPEIFDVIVAENGALLYWPSTRKEVPLAEPPPASFAEALRARGVKELAEGKIVVATGDPWLTTVQQTIRDLDLALSISLNKGAVMVLPDGVDKASGLLVALREMGLSPHATVGVGDAENDSAFLSICACAVAVGNALPELKSKADWVTTHGHGLGVVELVDKIVANDLAEIPSHLTLTTATRNG